MKKIGIITLAIGLASFTSFGQEDRVDRIDGPKKEKMSSEERAESRTKHMTKTLSLTDAQAKEVSAINIKHAKEMEKLHVEMKALKEKMKKEKEASRTQIDALLTDEQRAIVQQKHEERKKKKEEKKKDCCKK